jgi:hypothetical protein
MQSNSERQDLNLADEDLPEHTKPHLCEGIYKREMVDALCNQDGTSLAMRKSPRRKK